MEKFKIKRAYRLFILLLTLVSLLLTASCSESDKEVKVSSQQVAETPFDRLRQDSTYTNWPTYSYKTINVMYTPEHHMGGDLESFCRGYLSVSRRISKRLGMEPYTDSIYIVLYTGIGQGMALTGKTWSYRSDNVIHFWLPSYVGMLLTDLLLERWSGEGPKNQLMHHGMRSALDYTGLNYHEKTKKMIENGSFLPLDVLKDTTFYSDSERVQSAEAASLVVYLMSHYDIATIKKLYESEEPFEELSRQYLHMPLSQLEKFWLEFVEFKTADTLDNNK